MIPILVWSGFVGQFERMMNELTIGTSTEGEMMINMAPVINTQTDKRACTQTFQIDPVIK